MTTRRSFLLSAGLAPALSAAPSGSSIAQLPNRRGEAQPITAAERQARIERARQLMTENRINAICLAGGTSMNYFSGVRWGNSERLFAMILPTRGEPFFISPAFEEERAQEQIASGGAAHAKIFTWQEDESPYALLASALKESGLLTGRLAVEESMPFVFADGIAHAAPAATVISATPVTAGCRMIKSPAEIVLMRLASSVTLQAYEAAWKSIREGMTNREFSGLIGSAYQALGFPGYASAQVDEYSALPHGSVQPQTIRAGSIVLIDDGCTVEGYQSDISRTFVVGKATDKMGASRRARRGPSRPAVRSRGRGRAQGHRGCRLRSRLPTFHPSRGPRARDGRP
jgi:Xaa-Pro dipeptidase